MICVIGSTGLLGNSVGKFMLDNYGEDNISLSCRNMGLAYGKNNFYFEANKNYFSRIPNCEYLINCIGIIIPFMKENWKDSIYVNSVFPIELSEYCKYRKIKLITITTDCVFNGQNGAYNESSLHDPLDDYGRTKSLGEKCQDKCMLLRTSIIGEEIHKKASLIEWAKTQKDKTVNGFTNHLWNGVTTKQYAKICSKIIDNNLYEEGLFHVFSNVVTKYELLHLINDRFNLNLTIEPFETEKKCDRSLSTIKDLNCKLDIPSIKEQIEDS